MYWAVAYLYLSVESEKCPDTKSASGGRLAGSRVYSAFHLEVHTVKRLEVAEYDTIHSASNGSARRNGADQTACQCHPRRLGHMHEDRRRSWVIGPRPKRAQVVQIEEPRNDTEIHITLRFANKVEAPGTEQLLQQGPQQVYPRASLLLLRCHVAARTRLSFRLSIRFAGLSRRFCSRSSSYGSFRYS